MTPGIGGVEPGRYLVDSGIGSRPVPVHSHLAYFWETEQELQEALGFLVVGLKGSDVCVVLGAAEANEEVCRSLLSAGLDLEALEREGRFWVLNGLSGAMPLRTVLESVYRNAAARGAPLVRVLGNPGLAEADWPGDGQLLDIEAELTRFSVAFPTVVLCLYNVWTMPGFVVRHCALGTHPLVWGGEDWSENPFYAPMPEDHAFERAPGKRLEAALRDSERFSRATIDALSAQLCVLDGRGTIVAVNQSWMTFARENSTRARNVAQGANYLVVCDSARGANSQEAKAFAEGIRAVLRGNCAEFALEYPCHAPHQQRWFIGRVTRITNYEPVHLVVVHEDITARKLAEQKTAAAMEREAALSRQIHHRVKNSLQVISSLLSLESTQAREPAVREVLRENRLRARSIAIILELLCQRGDLSRIYFADYARQLTGELLAACCGENPRISIHVDAGGVFLDLDSALPCGLIVTELVSNCIKYAFRQGAEGLVSVEMGKAGGGMLILTVCDNGRGFPEGFAVGEAAGMGLKLVLELVGQLKGNLEAHNCGGARVRITFPDPAPPAGGKGTAPAGGGPERGSGPGC